MRFLCLGYLDVETYDALPEAKKHEIMTACFAQCEVFRTAGTIVMEHFVQRPRRAKTIRPGKSGSSVTDGPFIETKEQLGGFFIVEAADIDEAVAVASKHPGAMMGEEYGFGIEVRLIE
jgi:hypothetical protein